MKYSHEESIKKKKRHEWCFRYFSNRPEWSGTLKACNRYVLNILEAIVINIIGFTQLKRFRII